MSFKINTNSLVKTAIASNIQSDDEVKQLQKSRPTKYFKREGSPGNYKYYYSEQEYKEAKGKDESSEAPASKDDKSITYLKTRLGKTDAEITIDKNSKGDRIVKVNGQTAFNLDDRGMDEAGRKSALNRAYTASKSSNKSTGGDTPRFKPGDEGDLISYEGEQLSYRVYKDGGVKIEGGDVRKDFTSREDAHKWMKEHKVAEKSEEKAGAGEESFVKKLPSGKELYNSYNHPSHKDFDYNDHIKAWGIHREKGEDTDLTSRAREHHKQQARLHDLHAKYLNYKEGKSGWGGKTSGKKRQEMLSRAKEIEESGKLNIGTDKLSKARETLGLTPLE